MHSSGIGSVGRSPPECGTLRAGCSPGSGGLRDPESASAAVQRRPLHAASALGGAAIDAPAGERSRKLAARHREDDHANLTLRRPCFVRAIGQVRFRHVGRGRTIHFPCCPPRRYCCPGPDAERRKPMSTCSMAIALATALLLVSGKVPARPRNRNASRVRRGFLRLSLDFFTDCRCSTGTTTHTDLPMGGSAHRRRMRSIDQRFGEDANQQLVDVGIGRHHPVFVPTNISRSACGHAASWVPREDTT